MKTIRDYVDIIKKEYLKECKDVFYVADLLEFEDEDIGEVYEIFRAVKIDNANKEAILMDFEYSEDEDLVLKWEAIYDYSKMTQIDLNDKEVLADLIFISRNFLIHDFLVTELHHFKELQI